MAAVIHKGLPVTLSARIVTVVSLLACAAVPLAAQRARTGDDWLASCRDSDRGDDSRAHFCEIRNTGFKAAGGTITVDPGENGGVRFTGWDRDSVAVTAKIQTYAETDSDARELAQQVRIEASGGTIRADGPGYRRHASWSVSFDVQLPRRSDLEAETVNGPITVADVNGRMELRAQNGPLRLEAVGGDVHARTVNGPPVVTLLGERWDGTGLDSETENGPVVLTLPERYSTHLETGTVNGPMSLDIPVTLQGRINFHRISTDIGSGGPLVRAVTTNGPVTVRSQ
jgi:DUF4097 and DUF4098 domain-containing protein YvlB